MTAMSVDAVVGQLAAVLHEGIAGPLQAWSYFTDRGAEAGLIGTLRQLSPEAASRSVGGTSVAAHAHHTIFGMDAASAWIQGDRASRDWSISWERGAVNQTEWALLLERVQTSYDGLRQTIERHSLDSPESVGGAIAAIAHVAYHLGAIRQKIACGQLMPDN